MTDSIEKLEKQIRQTRLIGAVLFVALIVAACESRTISVVEAQKFVLRDSSGKVRTEIAMDHDYPVIRLFDKNGKLMTLLGAGQLWVSGEKGNATLLGDILQIQDGTLGTTLGFNLLGGEGGRLWLSGKDGTIVIDSDTPVMELSDTDGFRADLGRNALVTPKTGANETTSAAALVLSNKKGQILWRTP